MVDEQINKMRYIGPPRFYSAIRRSEALGSSLQYSWEARPRGRNRPVLYGSRHDPPRRVRVLFVTSLSVAALSRLSVDAHRLPTHVPTEAE